MKKRILELREICKNLSLTEMVEVILDKSGIKEELLKILAERQPLGRIAKPEEIANVVCCMASDQFSFMTGAEIKVDGGSTIGTL